VECASNSSPKTENIIILKLVPIFNVKFLDNHDGKVIRIGVLTPQTPHGALLGVHKGEFDLVKQDGTQRLQLVQTHDHTLRVHLRDIYCMLS